MPLIPLASYKTPRRVAAAQVSQLYVIPAPTGGLNYRDPISMMPPTDALALTNFIPRQTGVELRKGWQYHCDTITYDIQSMFSYNALDPTNNKLFAAANGDIYDVTTSTASIAQSATGSTLNQWSTTQFATTAGMFLLAVSPGAGYWTYDSTGGWIQRTVTGLPANPTSVAVFKNRVWFTVENSASVYYLDTVDAITGTCTEFPMGGLLRNGGSVRGLINWTLDAGLGIDDYLVVVGSQGDVGVWQGTDPSDPDKFSLRGVWYLGKVPKYGRFFTAYGGDVMVLSELGIVPISRLINGQFSEVQPGPSQKVQSVLNPIITSLIDTQAWDVFLVPAEDILVISIPKSGTTFQQFAMNVNTGAWCDFSDIPMRCAAMLNGQLYFGTEDGYVAKAFYGSLDAVAVNGTGGDAIEGIVQTAFNGFGSPAQQKKFSLARPIFIATDAPSVLAQINTQFDFANVAGSPSFTVQQGSRWGTGYWNTAIWVGSQNSYQAWIGATGLGYYGSLRMKVRGEPGTIFTSSHIMVEPGGFM